VPCVPERYSLTSPRRASRARVSAETPRIHPPRLGRNRFAEFGCGHEGLQPGAIFAVGRIRVGRDRPWVHGRSRNRLGRWCAAPPPAQAILFEVPRPRVRRRMTAHRRSIHVRRSTACMSRRLLSRGRAARIRRIAVMDWRPKSYCFGPLRIPDPNRQERP